MPTPTTRLDAETTLYERQGGLISFVFQREAGEDGTPPASNRPVLPTGTTALYNDPIAYGLQMVGAAASSPAAPDDSDVARVSARWVAFADLAEYRMIRTILGSFTDTTESDFGRSADYAKIADRAQKTADALAKQYETYLNPYRGGASSGPIRHRPPTACPPRWGPGYGGYGYGGPGGGCR